MQSYLTQSNALRIKLSADQRTNLFTTSFTKNCCANYKSFTWAKNGKK